jgi:hypothetical protein
MEVIIGDSKPEIFLPNEQNAELIALLETSHEKEPHLPRVLGRYQ